MGVPRLRVSAHNPMEEYDRGFWSTKPCEELGVFALGLPHTGRVSNSVLMTSEWPATSICLVLKRTFHLENRDGQSESQRRRQHNPGHQHVTGKHLLAQRESESTSEGCPMRYLKVSRVVEGFEDCIRAFLGGLANREPLPFRAQMLTYHAARELEAVYHEISNLIIECQVSHVVTFLDPLSAKPSSSQLVKCKLI